MTVKAKFKCTEKCTSEYNPTSKRTEYKFMAVYGKEGENATYSKYSPSGQLTIQVDEGTVGAELFKPGKDYYLEFTEAPEL